MNFVCWCFLFVIFSSANQTCIQFQPFLEKNVVRMGCSARDNSFFDDELLHKYNDIYHICNMYSILLYVYVYMYIYIYIYIV